MHDSDWAKDSSVTQAEGQGPRAFLPGLILASALITAPTPSSAFDLPLQATQYEHTSWTVRDGYSLGLVFAIAQTPDGYLWLGADSGLFRFDGLRFMPWEPPKGHSLPNSPYSLLVARDGTLWIGTFSGLASWNGTELTSHPQIDDGNSDGGFVTSLLEARDGTIWAGILGDPSRLCEIRGGHVKCHKPAGGFGSFVWSLAEDGSGVLWAGADSGLWRWNPGPPQRIETPGMRLGDLITTADGQLLAGIRASGLKRVAGDKIVPYPIRRADNPARPLPDRDVNSNKLLRDRDGGIWIGTEGRGIVHLQDGKADVFTTADGLSGDIACSLFEDREGNIWFASERGLDRFRKLPVTTLSMRQGLSSQRTKSVLVDRDASVWVATDDGLTRWKEALPTVFRERDGLPDAKVQSLYLDAAGRVWASTGRGLAYFANDRFVAVKGFPAKEIYSMTGDDAGNLWLSTGNGLAHLQDGRFIDIIPWAAFGRRQQAKVVAFDRGTLWLAFWRDGGVVHVKDGKVLATYTSAQGLGAGLVSGLRIDSAGTAWAATDGGLSRIKDGRVTTLSVGNGLPCNTIHWSAEDNNRSLWMQTACGLVRLKSDDVDAWIADPAHKVVPTLWGARDGVLLTSVSPAFFNPPVAKTPDGKLWFVAGDGVQVVDPDHIPFNSVPPPVHIENLVADHTPYAVVNGLRLPALVRDITIGFTALSFVDPKSMHFRYRLEGFDNDWEEAVDRRQVSYTNLPPGAYRFRLKASNNSGVWNEKGTQLEFSILPAYYQTTWFRALCTLLLVILVWTGYRLRIRWLRRQFEARLDARVAERTRIARDLHDTLLQSFHGLLLQFQTASNLLPNRPAESKKILASAIDQAAEAISEGRDTVQGLRASATETNDLADALRSLAEDLAQETGKGASVHVEVQGTPRTLRPPVRDEAFRIASEALRNAFHHAEAGQIEVEIRYEARQMRVRVRDNGKGIDPDVLRAGEKWGHFGLSGMRERADLAGGKLTVWSGLDAGTEVELSIPWTRAYSSPSTARSWLAQKVFGQSGSSNE